MKIVGRVVVPDPRHPEAPGTPVTNVAVGDGAVYMTARDCGLVVVGCPVAKARKPVYPQEPANIGYRQPYVQDLPRFATWTPRRRGQVRAVIEQTEKNSDENDFRGGQVNNGGAALWAYSLLQFKLQKPEEKKALLEALYRYCELDTLSMVFIWEYFNSEVEG